VSGGALNSTQTKPKPRVDFNPDLNAIPRVDPNPNELVRRLSADGRPMRTKALARFSAGNSAVSISVSRRHASTQARLASAHRCRHVTGNGSRAEETRAGDATTRSSSDRKDAVRMPDAMLDCSPCSNTRHSAVHRVHSGVILGERGVLFPHF